EWIEQSNLQAFRRFLKERHGLEFNDLQALRRWSVEHLEDFWQGVWDFFHIQSSTPPRAVLGRREMPGADWFPGATLNYAQHILRNEKPGTPALFHSSESRALTPMDWSELAGRVRVLATQLRAMGIKPGDRVAAYLPNTPEAVIALLASASVGAIWSSCSPDFGT